MVVQVQVLGVESVEMAPSLMVSTETQRLLFNACDGTQRMCMEHKVRLAKLQNVFLTELRTHTLGGLPGMVLTISDTGKQGLTVFGPEGTGQYLHATRFFLYRPQFKLEGRDLAAHDAAKTAATPVYADEEVRVFAAPMRGRVGHKRKLNEDMQLTEGANDAVSYVVETPEQRGKFLVEKAVKLGVPKGALFGQLHKGNDVTLPDGRVVRSADCVSASLPAGGVAIIACPALSFVDEVVNSPLFKRHQWQGDVAPQVQLQAVYHLGSEQILRHPQYIAWASAFGDDVDHVLLHHSNCNGKTVYRSSATLQAQLHAVFPHAFPSNSYEQRDSDTPLERTMNLSLSKRSVVLGESMLKYVVSPLNRRGFDTAQCFTRLQHAEIEASIASFKQQLPPTTAADASITEELNGRITFLGTGCAIPSKYRNVTGIYLQLPSRESNEMNGLLLDCGEGSLGQLYRYTNGDVEELRRLVQQLKCISISHNHADHHLGLLRFLSWRVASDEPLLLIAPPPVKLWLQEYERIDPSVAGKYTFIDNANFNESDAGFQESIPLSKPVRVWLEDTLQISNWQCVHVKHAFKAYAVVFTWKNTLKIAFSGDCRPSDEFADKARDAFILIHEATFDETMAAEAKSKDHSTTTEAMAVGKKANAKHVMLTHFSQRYPKLPASSGDDGGDAMSAMDLLSMRFADLHTQAQLMDSCLQILALDADAEDDE